MSMSENYRADSEASFTSARTNTASALESVVSSGNESGPKILTESMDFEETESVMWRKHQLRRFFQDRGQWWTSSRRTTAWKWFLVVLTGVLVGTMGYGVARITERLFELKFNTANHYINHGHWSSAFFSFMFFCVFFEVIAGIFCWIEPAAAGSGIPEIKSFLNGINLNKAVRIRVLFCKIIGMIFAQAGGLPLGKEGPMIHSGAVIGCAVSQGKTITFGLDTSWTKFQDLRNDRSKRDFVTFGAAAGVAAAFNAPIGGILFTLEEGASFWSTTLTFRAFFCAMITQLTLNIMYSGFNLGQENVKGLFAFGLFDDKVGYTTYELLIFAYMGACGGALGAVFNKIHCSMAKWRTQHIDKNWKRMFEVIFATAAFALITFIMPLCWGCNKTPTETSDWNAQEVHLLNKLVQYQCKHDEYNQVASLYFVPPDLAMQQLYHFKEEGGTDYSTFDASALMLFGIPYYLMAALCAGVMVPVGLFVPTLLAGAAFGRAVGHILNALFPGYVTGAGTYALMGAAALMGGMSRLTIAGTVILLEASGNSGYLLPLMLVFASARYTGNALNEGLYDMIIQLRELPFLEGSLKTLGLLNYHPIAEVMAQPVVTFDEICKVGHVYEVLSEKSHNGFPVVGKNGHLKGFIMRKHLCNLLKLKAFSTATQVDGRDVESPHHGGEGTLDDESELPSIMGGNLKLKPTASVFYDTLERNYPQYPKIGDISLNSNEMNSWLDIRPYMDTAPYAINASASIQRSYGFFRTMGLRHLIVLDENHRVSGIITRRDITEHRLEHHWFQEGDNMQKFINVDINNNNSSSHEGTSFLRASDMNFGLGTSLPTDSGEESDTTSTVQLREISNSTGTSVMSPVQQQQHGYAPPVAPPPPAAPTVNSRGGGSKASKEPKSVKSSK